MKRTQIVWILIGAGIGLLIGSWWERYSARPAFEWPAHGLEVQPPASAGTPRA